MAGSSHLSAFIGILQGLLLDMVHTRLSSDRPFHLGGPIRIWDIKYAVWKKRRQKQNICIFMTDSVRMAKMDRVVLSGAEEWMRCPSLAMPRME